MNQEQYLQGEQNFNKDFYSNSKFIAMNATNRIQNGTVLNPILGRQLISKKEFEYTLLSRYGLKIDKDCIHKYKDNYSCNRDFYAVEGPLVFTACFMDRFGFGWANTQGEFYKNHTEPKTELFKDFDNYINTHTFKIGKHFFI